MYCKPAKIILAIIFHAVCFYSFAQERQDIAVRTDVNWHTATVLIQAEYSLQHFDKASLPLKRQKAEQIIDSRKQEIVFVAFKDLVVSSSHTIEEYFSASPEKLSDFYQIEKYLVKSNSWVSSDLKNMIVEYSMPLYPGILAAFFLPGTPDPLPVSRSYTPSKNYTGIVIFVPSGIRRFSNREKVTPQKAVFPVVYDENMRSTYGIHNVLPEYRHKWGLCQYGSVLDVSSYSRRIGEDPLRIVARNMFGNYPSDIILSVDDTNQILANDHNKQLLKEGRVVIIYEYTLTP